MDGDFKFATVMYHYY